MVHSATYPAAGLSANGEVRVPILSEARGIRLPSDHPIKWPSVLEGLATRIRDECFLKVPTMALYSPCPQH